MPPKKRRQFAGALNYRRRRDVEVRDKTTRGDVRSSTSGKGRGGVEGGLTSGEVRDGVEEGLTSGEGRDGDEGGSMSGEERGGVEGGLLSGEGRGGVEEAEGDSTSRSEARVICVSTSDKGQTSTLKRPRLQDISTMAFEPLQEWLDNLPRDDLQNVALLLYSNLSTKFGLQKTDTAATVAEFLHKSERTIRRWIDDFVTNGGHFSDTQQGHYIRNNTLMSNEELCEKARVYVRENAAPRGRPNLTAGAFCQWVNNDLLPNSVLEPGYPRRVSVETARKWLHDLGFEILQLSKGVFIDGHERSDVVEARVKFLRTMTECGFLRPDNAPTEEATQALPAEVTHMTKEEGEKRILWFHDESAYNTTEDTPTLWGEKGKLPIKPKGRGSSIMVSEFIEERDGYLALSDEQYEFEVANTEQAVEKSSLTILEIGEQREGYWNNERFMEQVAKAVKIAEVKYPSSQGYHHIWCFDHSCGHTAFAEDALNASKMNKGPGGKQPKMRDTTWNGQTQSMTLPDGRPKGAALVLQERGYDTTRMKLEEIRTILASHEDFKNEKCRVDTFLTSCGHTCVFIPKFHCELNPIERVWSQSKRYTRAHCDYTIASLRRSIPLGLKSVSTENIANYVRRCRNYMYAYLEGSAVGSELEEKIRQYKSVSYTSHRRVGVHD